MSKKETIQKKITISDIAEQLGVSKSTVSRVISGKGRIGKDTKERVLNYIEKCNYKPNIIARSLAQSKTYNICIALPIDYNLVDLPFFQGCLMGVCNMASGIGYDVLVITVDNSDISQLTRVILNHKVDGVILTRVLENDIAIEYLNTEGIPFVVIGTTDDNNVIQIDNNHREACKELTSILLMKGLKNLALIGGNTTHTVTKSRYLGYKDAFLERNLEINRNLVYMDANNNLIIDKIVTEIFEKPVDCIICMDDLICSHVLNKLNIINKNIPKDIKIASFYNSTVLENHIPAITSLKFNVIELGIMACKMLIENIEGESITKKKLLDYEIVLKESTK